MFPFVGNLAGGYRQTDSKITPADFILIEMIFSGSGFLPEIIKISINCQNRFLIVSKTN